jgi:hypothetical protein
MYKIAVWFVYAAIIVLPPFYFIQNFRDLNELDALNNNGNYDTVIARNLHYSFRNTRIQTTELVSVKTGDVHNVDIFIGSRSGGRGLALPILNYKAGDELHIKFPDNWNGYVCEVQHCAMLRDSVVFGLTVSLILSVASILFSLFLWKIREFWLPGFRRE